MNRDLLAVGLMVLVGLAIMAAILVPLRRKRYRHWPTVPRRAFLTCVGFFAFLGAYAWIGLWYERHPLLGLAQFAFCAWLFWEQVMVPWQASAPSATRPPPPTVRE